MKSIREAETPLKFPRLMVETNSGDVYLMESPIYGVCVNKHDPLLSITGIAKGQSSAIMQDWKGKITLSNP